MSIFRASSCLGDGLGHVVERVDLVVVQNYPPPLLLLDLLLRVRLQQNRVAKRRAMRSGLDSQSPQRRGKIRFDTPMSMAF